MHLLSLFCLTVAVFLLPLFPPSFTLSSCPLSSLFNLSPRSSLSLSLFPHLSLLQTLLMATCLSIIDILTGLASRPPVAPLSSSLPYFTGALTRHTHTYTHKCTHTHTDWCTELHVHTQMYAWYMHYRIQSIVSCPTDVL